MRPVEIQCWDSSILKLCYWKLKKLLTENYDSKAWWISAVDFFGSRSSRAPTSGAGLPKWLTSPTPWARPATWAPSSTASARRPKRHQRSTTSSSCLIVALESAEFPSGPYWQPGLCTITWLRRDWGADVLWLLSLEKFEKFIKFVASWATALTPLRPTWSLRLFRCSEKRR